MHNLAEAFRNSVIGLHNLAEAFGNLVIGLHNLAEALGNSAMVLHHFVETIGNSGRFVVDVEKPCEIPSPDLLLIHYFGGRNIEDSWEGELYALSYIQPTPLHAPNELYKYFKSDVNNTCLTESYKAKGSFQWEGFSLQQ